jgi:hypothetical protein
MARDPKLGYHWIWMVPAYHLMTVLGFFSSGVSRAAARTGSWMNDRRYPDLEDLRTLAGIRKKGKKKDDQIPPVAGNR